MLQKNWIGRSEGAEVVFEIRSCGVSAQAVVDASRGNTTIFTTRPDTLFGATYMVIAPEHPLVSEITTPEQKDAVEAYQKSISSKSDMDRGDLNKDKSGVAWRTPEKYTRNGNVRLRVLSDTSKVSEVTVFADTWRGSKRLLTATAVTGITSIILARSRIIRTETMRIPKVAARLANKRQRPGPWI